MRPLTSTIILGAVLLGCSTAVYGPRLHTPPDVPSSGAAHGEVLKAHLKSGELVVLRSWAEDDTSLAGSGTRYGLNRMALNQGRFVLPFDSIALLESETKVGSRPSAMVGMAIWTAVLTVGTALCVADPKSCFGSCPTFYVATDTGEVLVAEGFSASVMRVLETKDLDALYAARTTGGPFTVRMRNEALETHAVRSLTLLAAPRPVGGRVLASPDGRFHPATSLRAPTACQAAEGDCLAALEAPDGAERTSAADSTDLAAKESIELSFPAGTGRLGIVLAARHSLMSTYLFYQTMGFLGSRAGETLAAFERAGPEAAGEALGMARIIGRIDVEVLDGDRWKLVGVHQEAGPLATHFEVFPFTHQAPGPVRIRLTASRGAWRIDWAAIAELGEPVEPITAVAESVLRDGRPDSTGLARLRDPDRYLVTYPGDTYDIMYRLPVSGDEWDVFLLSEGYYYEWMRSEWLDDEDPALAALAVTDPATALRVLAPGFKRAEPGMERLFWSSRFGRK